MLFLDVAYYSCMDENTGEMPEAAAGSEIWGCGSRICPANMTCMVRRRALLLAQATRNRFWDPYESLPPQHRLLQEHPLHPPLKTAGFGNVGLSLLSLFQVATLTGWSTQLYMVMDRAGPFSLVFYILYILLQCYFVVRRMTQDRIEKTCTPPAR